MILCLPLSVKRKFRLFRALLHFLVLAACVAPVSAQVFKWVDERGITHYGERPPQGVKASEVPNRLGSPAAPPPKTNADAAPAVATPAPSVTSPAPAKEDKTVEARPPDQCETQKELLTRLLENRQRDGRVQAETADAVARQEKLVAEQCKGR
jgi:Domain of unknown function (DUF4124)